MPTESAFEPVYVDINGLRQLARTPEQLALYLKSGAVEITPDMAPLPFEGELRQRAQDKGLETFATGAVEALSAGLYTDDSYLGQIEKEENPYAYAGGQAAGLVGGAIAAPLSAPGLAARAGTAAARGIASPVGRLAAEGAVDALTYATTRETIGAIVHDKPFSAEAIAAETLLGGGVGFALGGAIKGAGALRKALSKEDLAQEAIRRSIADVKAKDPSLPFSSPLREAPEVKFGDLDGQQIVGAGPVRDTEFAPVIETDDVIKSGPLDKEWSDFLDDLASRPMPADEVKPGFRESAAKGFLDDKDVASAGKLFRESLDGFRALERDMAQIPGDNPLWAVKYGPEAGPNTWARFSSDARALAKAVGKAGGKTDEALATGRDLFGRLQFDDQTFAKILQMKPAKRAEVIEALDRLTTTAKMLDSELDEFREIGPQWFHSDNSIEYALKNRGQIDETRGIGAADITREKRMAEIQRIAGRKTSDTHEAVTKIRSMDTGKATEKLANKFDNPVVLDLLRRSKLKGAAGKEAKEQLDSLVALVTRENGGVAPMHDYDLLDITRDMEIALNKRTGAKESIRTAPGKTETYSESVKTGPTGRTAKQGVGAKKTTPIQAPDGDGGFETVGRGVETEDAAWTVKRKVDAPKKPKGWLGGEPRSATEIKAMIAQGEAPHLEEIILLGPADQAAVFKALKPPHWASLGYELRTSPQILSYHANSAKLNPQDMFGLGAQSKRAMRWAEEADAIAAYNKESARQLKTLARGRAHNMDMPITDKTAPAQGLPGPQTGVAGILNRMNMIDLASSVLFPKAMAAKMVIQKYGARIAGAAESAMSNKVFQMTARKAPVIAWAKLVAPDGDDRDRNLRAIYAISESPGAFDAAVDQALGDIEADSPEQRVKAREVVTAQIQWLVQNAPASLSTLKKVWSPSTIAHFNRLIDAWQDPVGVMSRVQQAPTEQINAVRELWPTSYSEFMTKVVEQVAEHAAAGKPIPRGIGRILPMASPSWSVGGMQMLQSQQTQPVEMDQSGKFNSQTVAPTTVSESLSSNRINLNK